MEYKASLDRIAKTITVLITILFSAISFWNSWLMYTSFDTVKHFGGNIIAVILILIIYAGCYLFRPISYVIEKNWLIIKRPLKDYQLDIDKIKNASLLSDESMKWTARTFGVGGLFGYYGKFRNQTFGGMTWYATQRKNYLVIETINNRKIVLTPDDTDMLKEIEKLIKKSIH